MRISGNQQSYYQSTSLVNSLRSAQGQNQSSTSSASGVSAIFANASLISESANDTTGSSASEILSSMNQNPQAQMMKMRMREELSTEQKAALDAMKEKMDTLASTDLEALSEEEQAALLEELQASFEAAHGENPNQLTVSELTSEEVTAELTKLKEMAINGPGKGPGGPGRPSGPGGPPPGPPPSGAAGETESTTSNSIDIEAILEALESDEEDADTKITNLIDYLKSLKSDSAEETSYDLTDII